MTTSILEFSRKIVDLKAKIEKCDDQQKRNRLQAELRNTLGELGQLTKFRVKKPPKPKSK